MPGSGKPSRRSRTKRRQSRRLSRAGRIMEIDPRYVDVIVGRWEQFTGKKAVLEGLGATFEHVKEGRLLEGEDAIKEELVEMMEGQS